MFDRKHAIRSCLMLLVVAVRQAVAGECCKAYTDLTFTKHDAVWCSDYCCWASALGALQCCDNLLFVAPESDRSTLCLDFFAKNIWAPIVIGLGGLGAMICCCVCIAMCSSGSRRGTVVAPQQPAANVIMVAGQQPVQGQMPGQMQGQMPGQMQGQMPGQMQGQMPGYMQGQMPGQIPGQIGGPAYPPVPGSTTGTGLSEQTPPAYAAQYPTKS